WATFWAPPIVAITSPNMIRSGLRRISSRNVSRRPSRRLSSGIFLHPSKVDVIVQRVDAGLARPARLFKGGLHSLFRLPAHPFGGGVVEKAFFFEARREADDGIGLPPLVDLLLRTVTPVFVGGNVGIDPVGAALQ